MKIARPSSLLFVLAIGCNKSTSPAPPGSTTIAPASADLPASANPPASADLTASANPPAASATASPSATASARAFSPAARTALVHALSEGRRLAKAKDYKGALAKFDQALAIDPDDARILAEASWAAFNAGDFLRAGRVNDRALMFATTAVLRAPILYNAGRLAEAQGKKDEARAWYAASLAARDSAEVKRRFEALGGNAEEPAAWGAACASGAADETGVCACLLKEPSQPIGPDEKPAVCAQDEDDTRALGNPRLRVIHWGYAVGELRRVLLARDGSVLRPVATLGLDILPGGVLGLRQGVEVGGSTERKVGARLVVVVRSKHHSGSRSLGALETCSEQSSAETVCALGDGTTATKCAPPISVQLESACEAEPPEDPDPETQKLLDEIAAGPGRAEAKLAYVIDETGVVVRFVSGERLLVPAGQLGTHRLW